MGLTASLVLLGYVTGNSDSPLQIPLLTALLMSEFCFLVSSIAAGVCVRTLVSQGFNKIHLFLFLGNLVLAVNLLFTGLKIWAGLGGE